jgi:hypothetical protein
MRVKGKALNSFLGFMKTDIARLSVEAFPQEINKQLISLMLLPKADLCWFDIQIDRRIATLRSNVFVGVNIGNKFFKVGFLCLIGIAHLPESLRKLKLHKRFELRPCLTTNIGPMIEEELQGLGKVEMAIIMNLFHAVRLISSRVLPHVPTTSNVVCEDGVLQANRITTLFKGEDVEFASDVEHQALAEPVITFLKDDELGDKVRLVDLKAL